MTDRNVGGIQREKSTEKEIAGKTHSTEEKLEVCRDKHDAGYKSYEAEKKIQRL